MKGLLDQTGFVLSGPALSLGLKRYALRNYRRRWPAPEHAILTSMSTTLIRNGKIVNADRTQEADLLISGEKILDIAPGLPVERGRPA